MILEIKKSKIFLQSHLATCTQQQAKLSIQLNYCHKALHILENMVRHSHTTISRKQ